MYTISEVSKKLDLPATTIRYYDSKGLLPYVQRDGGGRRLFSEEDVELLAAFVRASKAGLTLKEARELFNIVTVNEDLEQGKAILLDKRSELHKQIAKTEAAIEFLDKTIRIYELEIQNRKAKADCDA